MRTINFGKYLRLFQIEPIKTVEFRFVQIGKIGAKILPRYMLYMINSISDFINILMLAKTLVIAKTQAILGLIFLEYIKTGQFHFG